MKLVDIDTPFEKISSTLMKDRKCICYRESSNGNTHAIVEDDFDISSYNCDPKFRGDFFFDNKGKKRAYNIWNSKRNVCKYFNYIIHLRKGKNHKYLSFEDLVISVKYDMKLEDYRYSFHRIIGIKPFTGHICVASSYYGSKLEMKPVVNRDALIAEYIKFIKEY